MIGIVAQFFGISVLRLVLYSAITLAVTTGGLVIRQHYINKGYASAISAVKKQDDRAEAAADRAKQKADDCSAQSYWDVISQSCKTEDAE